MSNERPPGPLTTGVRPPGPARSSQLLAMTNPLAHGFVPVRLFGDIVVPRRTASVLAGEVGIDARSQVFVRFLRMENGRIYVEALELTEKVRPNEVIVFAIMYISDPSARAIVDRMLGPLRPEWDDYEAAEALIRELTRSLAPRSAGE